MTFLALTLGLLVATEADSLPAKPEKLIERSQRIRSAFDEVRADSLHLLDELYDETLVFEDPLGRLEGLEEFKIYMEAMYQFVEDIQWEYTDEVIQGDTHSLYWTMTLKTKSLNKGDPFSVEGTSRIVFGESNKVVYHRDYFDMGAYVYERAPVIRWFVKIAKRRLHKAVKKIRADNPVESPELTRE